MLLGPRPIRQPVHPATRTPGHTHLASVTHSTGPVAAAALALAEWQKISAADFLQARIPAIGIEGGMANVLTAPPAKGNAGF